MEEEILEIAPEKQLSKQALSDDIQKKLSDLAMEKGSARGKSDYGVSDWDAFKLGNEMGVSRSIYIDLDSLVLPKF